ncbi:MAG: hypothetical protein VKJ24_01060 [Synechococcales bacterium]|nr:hypothetical protein [Synechococcales bacterium]
MSDPANLQTNAQPANADAQSGSVQAPASVGDALVGDDLGVASWDQLGRPSPSATAARVARVVQNARMPLAIYRELATHLEQVDGVQVECLAQDTKMFDYLLSQIKGLRIQFPNDPAVITQVDHILSYYGDRYGAWS